MEHVALTVLFIAVTLLALRAHEHRKRINLLERDVTYLMHECYELEIDEKGKGNLHKVDTE